MRHEPALVIALLSLAAGALAMSPEVKQQVEADWIRQEQVTRGLKHTDAKALDGVLARGRMLIADIRELGNPEPANRAQTLLDEIARKRGDIGAAYLRARWALRELAFNNPKLDFDELLFVKRQWPRNNHQCSHRMGEAQIAGANLCVLKGLSPDGEVREILDPDHAKGGVGRPDLSYDARRIVFPYARPREKPTPYGYGKPGVRGGECYAYDIYEINVDGTGLRQLTRNGDEIEDTEPFYLPDGRIGFTTSRDGRLVQCGDWALACGVYSMAPDGSDPRRITEPKEGEFYPSMLEDGRILYTRWDYVMKAFNVIQQLWAVNPDGRAAALVYGDHYSFSRGPIAFFEARQIPGTSKVICTGGAHHNTCAGPIMIVDLKHNRGGPEGMANVTPEFGDRYPESGGSNTKSPVGWYSSPYPLSEKQYLVTYSFENDNIARHGYALYLMDVHGNKELIYRATGASCYSPIPIRPRPKPHVIPDMVSSVEKSTPGTLVVVDIYQGLEGVERGTVKYLRVLQTHSKCVRTTPQRADVGVSCGWDVRGVLGTVPVEPDGSLHFQVPPFTQIFFEALDADYLEIRRMRNFMNVMPGETNSCVGCHEPYGTAPTPTDRGTPLALKRPASKITPPPWGTEGLSFERVVQPVLDKHCIKCHRPEPPEEAVKRAKGKSIPDFTRKGLITAPAPRGGDAGPQHCVSDAYLNLLKYVSYVQVGGHYGVKVPLAPNATGSRASRLMKLLKSGHSDVKLSTDEWRAFAAWIDCNAPYYGSWAEVCSKPTMAAKATRTTSAQPKPLRTQSQQDIARIAARKKALSDEGGRLLGYLDCGLQIVSEGGPVSIRQLRGKGWRYAGSEAVKEVSSSHRDITFDDSEVLFRLSGLDPKAGNVLHLTWWDFNNNGRRQSVWVSGRAGKKGKQIQAPTLLPAWMGKKELPQHLNLAIPKELIDKGTAIVTIKRHAGANCVLGELWVMAE